jgi:signal peptidase I
MVIGLVIVVTVFLMLFGFLIVEGNDMYPSLCDGDLVLTYRNGEFIKNDIVFYEAEGELHCGRVVAKSGDSVSIFDDKLFVNGTPQTTEIAFPTTASEKWENAVSVPDNTVFVLGDYRSACEDSRVFGFIPTEKVKSKVIVMLRHKTL